MKSQLNFCASFYDLKRTPKIRRRPQASSGIKAQRVWNYFHSSSTSLLTRFLITNISTLRFSLRFSNRCWLSVFFYCRALSYAMYHINGVYYFAPGVFNVQPDNFDTLQPSKLWVPADHLVLAHEPYYNNFRKLTQLRWAMIRLKTLRALEKIYQSVCLINEYFKAKSINETTIFVFLKDVRSLRVNIDRVLIFG